MKSMLVELSSTKKRRSKDLPEELKRLSAEDVTNALMVRLEPGKIILDQLRIVCRKVGARYVTTAIKSSAGKPCGLSPISRSILAKWVQ